MPEDTELISAGPTVCSSQFDSTETLATVLNANEVLTIMKYLVKRGEPRT